MKPKPPWWFCCGWWSPWCVLDTFIHEVLGVRDAGHRAHSLLNWICDKHDAVIWGGGELDD